MIVDIRCRSTVFQKTALIVMKMAVMMRTIKDKINNKNKTMNVSFLFFKFVVKFAY